MAKDVDNVTLGTGDLYLNNVEVGHLKGDVVLEFEGEVYDFKAANSLGVSKRIPLRESTRLRASLAEIKAANVRLAFGVTTAIVSSQSFPSYDPSSYSVPASASYDIMKFGSDKTQSYVSLRFEHTIANDDKKIIVVLYRTTSNRMLNLPFHEEEVSLQDVVFEGFEVDGRAEGDRVGFVAIQVQEAG